MSESKQRKPGSGLRVIQPERPVPAEAPATAPELTLDEVRGRLDGQKGRGYWRSLDELAQTPEFEDLLHREFPRQASTWGEGVDRRGFLQLAGASLALAGLAGCTRQPEERIVPYVRKPEEIIPGKPLYFATSVTHGGYARGLLAESHMGRPTKLEGNPEHPASLGGTSAQDQAAVLGLYDPDRSTSVLEVGRLSAWGSFADSVGAALTAQEALGGAGLRILTETVTSPTLGEQIEQLRERFPQAQWHQWEPVNRDAALEGAQQAFGQFVDTRYDLSQADVIVALDADLLAEGPAHVRYAKDFARRRRAAATAGGDPSRLYAVESSPTSTGTVADHRLALKPSQVAAFAAALAARVGAGGSGSAPEGAEEILSAAAEDLQAHQGRGLVVAGDGQPAAVHALALAINQALGNTGTTVVHTEPAMVRAELQLESLKSLVEAMNAGRVDLLVVLGANPVLTAPANLAFGEAMRKVGLRVHLGLYADETAEYCHWHVPEAHFLEGWSDARAFDGTVSLVQPLIEPLYGGKTAHQMLAFVAGRSAADPYALVAEAWRARLGESEFEDTWLQVRHDGFLADSASAEVSVAASGGVPSGGAGASELEISFRPDPSIYDGRFANNGWLQELPKPVTKLTWDNALMISPGTVEALGLAPPVKKSILLPDQLHGEQAKAAALIAATGKMVKLTVGERSLEVPLWVLPGQADGALTLHFGYGRTRGGRIADGTGFDAYRVWSSAGGGAVTLEDTGRRYELASTQSHHNIPLEGLEAEDRHLVRTTTLEHFKADPEVIHDMGAHGTEYSLYPAWEYPGHAWGMAIDLSACLGCNACVAACQAENNIPVVGKDEVIRGHEMHWLRIDRYFEGDIREPRIHNQPVPCMHCEQAPCEVVCPVGATVHSDEGLNDMVYNRCVGTRYCSNNCPYKVRRFNWFNFYHRDENSADELRLGRNPDVTVRTRGVMEKCTYCVQRINAAKIEAEVAGNALEDGTIQTACQQACPSDAIVFGDINDEGSEVSRWKATALNYGTLEELGTRPRTTYLAKVSHPHPTLAPAPVEKHGSGGHGSDGHGSDDHGSDDHAGAAAGHGGEA